MTQPVSHARRRESTRAAIITAAVELFAEKGFTASSVEEIAARAGVAKGSVFYNFGTKSEIMAALLRDGIDQATTELRTVVAGYQGWGALAELVAQLLRLVRDNTGFAKLIAAEIFRTDREWSESARPLRSDTIQLFVEAIDQIPAAERPGVEPSLAGATVFGATLVTGLEWLAFQPDRPFEEVRDSVIAVVGRR